MNYLKLTYTISGRDAPGELILDLVAQRWNDRIMVLAIVKHEFPLLRSEPMTSPEWNPERVLERFGIADIRYAFVEEGCDDPDNVPLADFRLRKRPRQPSHAQLGRDSAYFR